MKLQVDTQKQLNQVCVYNTKGYTDLTRHKGLLRLMM